MVVDFEKQSLAKHIEYGRMAFGATCRRSKAKLKIKQLSLSILLSLVLSLTSLGHGRILAESAPENKNNSNNHRPTTASASVESEPAIHQQDDFPISIEGENIISHSDLDFLDTLQDSANLLPAGNSDNSEVVNLVFSAGIHGNLVEDGTVWRGNRKVQLNLLEDFALLPLTLLPQVRSDAEWEFIGFKVRLVPQAIENRPSIALVDPSQTNIFESAEYNYWLEKSASGNNFQIFEIPNPSKIYSRFEMSYLSYKHMPGKVYLITAQYLYKPQAPRSAIELSIFTDVNTTKTVLPIIATGEHSSQLPKYFSLLGLALGLSALVMRRRYLRDYNALH